MIAHPPNSNSSRVVDEEAMRLLMVLRPRIPDGRRTEPAASESTKASRVDEEARNLLHSLGSFPSVPPFRSNISSSLIKIDTSGEEGRDGYPNMDSASSGEPGSSGMNGNPGGNARDIHLYLTTEKEEIVAKWEDKVASLRLGDPAASVFLRSVGGKGGNGGNGGNGGAGRKGARGQDATRYSSGTDGEPGQTGGCGGNGGLGGKGGTGGQVSVNVSPEDADLLMLLNIPDVGGGVGGRGGYGGIGGIGGEGGAGGASWSGIEYQTRYVSRTKMVYSAFHKGMEQQLVQELETVPVQRFNPGGRRGSDGRRGIDGPMGNSGVSGNRGSFAMIVGDKHYSSRYDFLMNVSKVVDLTHGNPSDVYEPGERVCLAVTMTNEGGMQTSTQDVELSLQPVDWIEPEVSSVKLSKQLAVGETYLLPIPFSFRIKESGACSQEPLNQPVALTYRAVALRVNKSFASISGQRDFFTLTYPVHLSPVIGKVHPEEMAQLATVSLAIENIATIALGKSSSQKRKIIVAFEVEGSDAVEFLAGIKGEEAISVIETESNPRKKEFEIDCMAPKSRKQLEISFRMPTSAKVEGVAALYLDSFPPESRGMRCIQMRRISLGSL